MRLYSAMAGAFLLCASVGVSASEGIYMGPSLSHYLMDDDRVVEGEDDDSTALGVNLGYRFPDQRWGIEAGFRRDIGGAELDVVKLDALYSFERRDGWAPFFVMGVSHFSFGDDVAIADDDDTQQVGAGFGIAKMLDRHWEGRLDGRFLQQVGGDENTTDLAFNLALNYYFNPSAPAAAAEPEPAPVTESSPEPEPEPEYRTITVELRVLFEFDKAVVRDIYGDELEAVARAMKEHEDIDLLLEGHTDSIGTEDYNQDLSERRAAAVEEKLVEEYGLDPDRVDTAGYGESRPVADNSTAEGREKNRRVIGEVTYEEVVD